MMQKSKFVVALAVAALMLSTGVALAEQSEKSVTVEGKIACAKCTLQTGAKECQDVLVVEKGEQKVMYYMVANDVSKEFGHTCMDYKPAVVTGMVEEKDGKMWLTATKMVAPDKG